MSRELGGLQLQLLKWWVGKPPNKPMGFFSDFKKNDERFWGVKMGGIPHHFKEKHPKLASMA